MIIAIAGAAGSGKSTAARLVSEYKRFAQVAFADPFKRMLVEVMGFSSWDMFGHSDLRNKPDDKGRTRNSGRHQPSGVSMRCAKCGKEWVDSLDECSFPVTIRNCLQNIGEAGRQGYPRMWADHAVSVANMLLTEHPKRSYIWDYTHENGLHGRLGSKMYAGVIFTDMRHDDEALAVREAGGIIVRIDRVGSGLQGEEAKHVSEGGISPHLIHYVVDNNHSFSDLDQAMRAIVDKHLVKLRLTSHGNRVGRMTWILTAPVTTDVSSSSRRATRARGASSRAIRPPMRRSGWLWAECSRGTTYHR